jgi:hypothetical protein
VSLREIIDEDRRLVILRLLEEADGYSLNEELIEKSLARIGVLAQGRDIVRGHLAWLDQQRLVTLDRLPMGGGARELWVAKATKLGTEVAGGRPWPGVARPLPG